MLTREKYCAVCGCPFSVPFIRNPENPDPDEDSMLVLNNPYDSRLLPRELTTVFHPDFRCSESVLIEQTVAQAISRGRSMAEIVRANFP